MIKKLIRHGNSLALVIDKPILDLLKIDDSTPLELVTDGNMLVVRPQREQADQEKVEEALKWVNEKYGNALRNLAE